MDNKYTGMEIAIIGMAGRFPQATDIDQFWANLLAGKESISFFSRAELQKLGFPIELLNDSNYIKAKGVLEDADCFDYSFFDYSLKEAQIMNPQTRQMHEIVWAAFENAGYDPEQLTKKVGFYAGASTDQDSDLKKKRRANPAEAFSQALLKDKDFMISRIAYKFNFTGPCISLHTGCSTSLAAVHLACRGLLTGECDLAVAGGSSISYPFTSGYIYQEGMVRSADGHCKPFHPDATGTVAGNGAGVVILKRLQDAIQDGDHIYAMIRGSSLNNDGAEKIGYTAPGLDGLSRAIKNALSVARLKPEDILYIETHGTGTKLGDQIELAAMGKIWTDGYTPSPILGFVKANIGHLDTAAGIAGLIKTTLLLNKRQIPPVLHFAEDKEKVSIEDSPFYINSRVETVPEQEVFRAGINSLGIGGTNVHLVLEELPKKNDIPVQKTYKLFIFSGPTKEGLIRLIEKYAAFFTGQSDLELMNVSYTLKTGRHPFGYQMSFLATDVTQVRQRLIDQSDHYYEWQENTQPITFWFDHLTNKDLLQELYTEEPLFKQIVEQCLEKLRKAIHISLEFEDCIEQIPFTMSFIAQYTLANIFLIWNITYHQLGSRSIGQVVQRVLEGKIEIIEGLKLAYEWDLKEQLSLPSIHTFSNQVAVEEVGSLIYFGNQGEEIHPSPSQTCFSIGKGTIKDFYLQLLNIWAAGIKIDWKKYHAQDKCSKIPLPGYPFKKEKVALSNQQQRVTKNAPDKETDIQKIFYTPIWQRGELMASEVTNSPALNWLIFKDSSGVANKFINKLTTLGQKVRYIESGDCYQKCQNYWVFDYETEDNYSRLVDDLEKVRFIPDKIVHFGPVPLRDGQTSLNGKDFELAQGKSFYSLLYLMREALNKFMNIPLELGVITQNSQEVLGNDLYYPEYATVQGLCKVFVQEYTSLNYKIIDLDLIQWKDKKDDYVDAIYGELLPEMKNEIIAFRGNYKWKPDYRQIQVQEQQKALEKNQIYVIFGGLGRVGLAIAENLVQSAEINLVLTGKSYFPKRDLWDHWLGHSRNELICERILKIRQLEESGSKISIRLVDLSNPKQLKKVLTEIESQLGPIRGVIHAAGIVGEKAFRYLDDVDLEFCQKIFAPKVNGFIHLEEYFSDKPLDFCLCISSLAAVLGGIGQTLYSAANLFMDYYAIYLRSCHKGRKWKVIDLETWLVPNKKLDFATSIEKYQMSYEEGKTAIQYAMGLKNVQRVILSTGNLKERIKNWSILNSSELPHSYQMEQFTQEQMEEIMRKIWSEYLSQEITIKDDFFEVGGNSLRAIQLVANINSQFHIRLKLTDLFENSTVITLCKKILDKYQVKLVSKKSSWEIEKAREMTYYPTTYIQKSMTYKTNYIYEGRFNLGHRIDLQGSLDVDKLNKAVEKLIQRHESLRTSFQQINGELVQQITPHLSYELAYFESLDDRTVEARVREFVKPFHLEKAPLLRLELIQLNRGNYILLHDMHHIIFDESSLQIFYRDLWNLYQGQDLPPLEYQYKEFAVWQEHVLKEKGLASQQNYWEEKLRKVIPFTLPGDLFGQEIAYRRYLYRIQSKAYTQLERILKRYSLTKFNLLLTIFLLAIDNETERDVIALNMRITNRVNNRFQEVMGCFLEKVILVFNLDPNQKLLTLMKENQHEIFDSVENGIFPHELVNKISKTQNTPLSNLLINYIDAEQLESNIRIPDLKISYQPLPKKIFSKYGMNIKIYDQGTSVTFDIKYQSSMYSKRMMNRIFAKYQEILEKILKINDIEKIKSLKELKT